MVLAVTLTVVRELVHQDHSAVAHWGVALSEKHRDAVIDFSGRHVSRDGKHVDSQDMKPTLLPEITSHNGGLFNTVNSIVGCFFGYKRHGEHSFDVWCCRLTSCSELSDCTLEGLIMRHWAAVKKILHAWDNEWRNVQYKFRNVDQRSPAVWFLSGSHAWRRFL